MDRKFLINDSIENEFHQKASEQELAAQMYFEVGNYKEAIESYRKSAKILQLCRDQLNLSDDLSKLINVYWKMNDSYEALAKQTNSLEPLEYAIASLTNLLKYRPYDRNIRLKRCALWKTLQNRENALTDALVYFCTELSKDCLDVPLENINKVLSDDLKLLINEECNQIDSYAQSLKPFLTQDFINLWLSCDCDDPLVEDIWKVRAEELGTLPDGVVPVRDGTYKKALKALSSGKLSSVVKNLEKASLNGKYRLEATLLLALAHTREDGAAVDKFLDRFERIWVQKPAGYSSRRCKQLVVRYVSMSRAIRYDPFSGQKLENETKEIEANLYLQEALIIFWRRQKCEIGEIFWKKELKNDNRRKLQHIQKLCNLALKAKPDFHHAKILKLRSILELQMAVSISILNDDDLKPLENIVNKTNDTLPVYSAFGDLCLYSIYLANSRIDKARLCCQRMSNALFFGGQPSAFLIRCDWNVNNAQTLERLDMLIGKEPENYVAHILMYYYHFKHGELDCALEHADHVLKYWPYHTNTDNVLAHVREYVHCRLLQAVQKELDVIVEASLRMLSRTLPDLNDLWRSHTGWGKTGKIISITANTSEARKSTEISEKTNNCFYDMEQFYHKLDILAQKESKMLEISTEKDQDSKICEKKTASTGDSSSLDKSRKLEHLITFEERVENAGKIISATFCYAEQLRRDIEYGQRAEKDKRRNEEQTLNSEELAVLDEEEAKNDGNFGEINQSITTMRICSEEEELNE